MDTLPKTVETFRARADAGFHCWKTVKAYTDLSCEFVIALVVTTDGFPLAY